MGYTSSACGAGEPVPASATPGPAGKPRLGRAGDGGLVFNNTAKPPAAPSRAGKVFLRLFIPSPNISRRVTLRYPPYGLIFSPAGAGKFKYKIQWRETIEMMGHKEKIA
jgi:hypothetical protein